MPNRETWKDWLGQHQSQDVRTYRPRTADDVVAAVLAEPKLKAVGAGHADNCVARPNPDTAMIDPTRMDDVGLEPRTPGSGLARVEAGARIREINRKLGGLGRGLVNMGSFDEQTVSGAFATGTHGSGAAIGPLCDTVRAFEFVDGRGRKFRVDDPARPVSYETGEPLLSSGTTWIKDDADLFRALGVNLGAIGIVTAVVLDTLPAYRLWERRITGHKWEDLKVKDVLQNARTYRHYELAVNPMADADGEHAILETFRDFVEKKGTKDVFVNRPTGWPAPSPYVERELVLMSARAGAEFADLLAWRREPDKIGPRLTKGMDFLAAGQKLFVGPGDEILMLRLGAEAHGFELFVPADSPKLLKQVMDLVFERFRDWNRAGEAPEQRCVGTAPMGVRFVKGSPQWLAPTSSDTAAGPVDLWCSIEIPRLKFPDDDESRRFRHYPDAVVSDIWHDVKGLGVRAHWGQQNFLAPGELAPLYPHLATWQAVAARTDPDRRFVNRWAADVGLR